MKMISAFWNNLHLGAVERDASGVDLALIVGCRFWERPGLLLRVSRPWRPRLLRQLSRSQSLKSAMISA
jgi:hypothetical protein